MAASFILRSLHRRELHSVSSSAYRILISQHAKKSSLSLPLLSIFTTNLARHFSSRPLGNDAIGNLNTTSAFMAGKIERKKGKKEKKQESEWLEAQKIVLSLDLLDAAKRQLRFLSEVDCNPSLYDGPVLQRAINRCATNLIASNSMEAYWITLALSSVTGISRVQTEEIWNQMYPNEAYHFDLKNEFISNEKLLATAKCTEYDLVSAVKRQSTFFHHVSEAHMQDDVFLEEAVARYKGFLHLIRRNMENSVKRFCVPTYDIDLIWHTHQLHPVSYCKDLEAVIGKVLNHDDTDSDRTKGSKLEIGFSETTKQWEDTFGTRYWKEGAILHRGKNVGSCGVGCGLMVGGGGGCGGACGGMLNSGGSGAGRGDIAQSSRDGGSDGGGDGLFGYLALCGGECGGGCGGGCGGCGGG